MRDDKKSTAKKTFSFWGIVLVVLTVFLIYTITARTIENFLLAKYGVAEKAIVTAKFKVGSKGILKIDYIFNVGNKRYEGSTENENYQQGERINILYLRKRPEINRTYNFIKENYSTNK